MQIKNQYSKQTQKLILALLLFAALACNLSSGEAPAANSNEIPEEEGPEAPLVIPTPEEGGQTGVWEESACGDLAFEAVADFEVRQTPAMDEPAPRVPFLDPVFGTCVVRVSNRAADLSEEDDSTGLKNEYSRVQSFNADGSLLLARSIEGYWYLYQAATLEPLGRLPLEVEPRWDAEDPNLIYHMDETRLLSYRLSNSEEGVVHDFAEDFPGQGLAAVWTRYEGSPSIDGRYWGLMAEDEEWLTAALLVYDMERDEVVAKRELASRPEIDSVSISPLGTYLLAYYDNACEEGQTGDEANPCGLMVYDRELESGRSLLRIVGHSDTALDAQGREVLIYQDIDTDHIAMLDLASGEITTLRPIDFSHSAIGLHFSGRAFERPGWVLVSTYSGAQPSATWMDDQVFAVELKAGGRVVRLAHTHAIVDEDEEHDYWAEPHASVNPDFTRIVFTSNWGRSGTGEVEIYMIVLPPDWMGQLP